MIAYTVEIPKGEQLATFEWLAERGYDGDIVERMIAFIASIV